jgi:DnaJ-class molecular chaperone
MTATSLCRVRPAAHPLLCSLMVLCLLGTQLFISPVAAWGRSRSQAPAKPEIEEKDLYAVLGVPRDADEAAIRSAYRKLSRQYHPDKNPNDDEAAQKFRAISEANDILSDEEKKFMYDRGGMKAVAEAEQPQGQDPFAAFFGHAAAPSGAPRTDPMHFEVPIDLAALYTGESMQTNIQVLTHCEGCKKGSEQRNSERCQACRTRCPNEVKMVQRQMGPGFIVNQQMEVPSEEKCTKETRTLDLLIEKGAKSGVELLFKGKGNRHPDKLPGDVHIQIKEQPHDFFKRSGNDLLVTWKISLKESLVGGQWSFPALDGHIIEFGTDAVTKPGETWRIRGEVSQLLDRAIRSTGNSSRRKRRSRGFGGGMEGRGTHGGVRLCGNAFSFRGFARACMQVVTPTRPHAVHPSERRRRRRL